eukprot:CAMPEP_0181100808 /NCGR_PEP_ID=MMETSP1071-20121207/13396_1 /TAXON_ID=35127 /ORGANISM="Thalassiosira sp., Strain NH16" /LENGTH=168 /DNA_ID=CAMNT_0023183573 /DNA_START=105 /DNA_END=608 /DNA_ORIENTATION=+
MPPMMPQCPRRSFGPGAEDGRSLLSARRPVATSSSVAIAADAASSAAPAAAAVALRPGAVLGATSVVLRQGKAVLGRVMAPAVHGGVEQYTLSISVIVSSSSSASVAGGFLAHRNAQRDAGVHGETSAWAREMAAYCVPLVTVVTAAAATSVVADAASTTLAADPAAA